MNVVSVPAIIVWVLVSYFFQMVWIRVLSKQTECTLCHMYSLCWRSVHSHMAMYSCGATTCIPPHKYAHAPTGTHLYTLSEVIYIWVTAYLISENQSKIAFSPRPSSQHRHSYFREQVHRIHAGGPLFALLPQLCNSNAGFKTPHSLGNQSIFPALIAAVPFSKVLKLDLMTFVIIWY